MGTKKTTNLLLVISFCFFSLASVYLAYAYETKDYDDDSIPNNFDRCLGLSDPICAEEESALDFACAEVIKDPTTIRTSPNSAKMSLDMGTIFIPGPQYKANGWDLDEEVVSNGVFGWVVPDADYDSTPDYCDEEVVTDTNTGETENEETDNTEHQIKIIVEPQIENKTDQERFQGTQLDCVNNPAECKYFQIFGDDTDSEPVPIE